MDRNGAMAEMSFHLSMLTPLPTKPIAMHRLQVSVYKAISIERTDFPLLGIDPNKFASLDYDRCQTVGDAAGFLGFDALLVPSARWHCKNLVLLQDSLDLSSFPELLETEEVDWQVWARRNGVIV
jgi:hypothetical protein